LSERRETIETQAGAPAAGRRRWLYFLPVLVFGGLAIALAFGLGEDPSEVPSPLIDKPVPVFELPPVPDRVEGFSDVDLKQGEVALVNVFSSWCGPCRIEHPLLMRLSEEGDIPIYGLNYKDRPEDAKQWLDEMGDPYRRTGSDLDGRVGIDWGVYGVPETFIVDGEGRIRFKHIGYISREALEKTIRPIFEELTK
jgi:cytochrome c biogenesis protein CcmG/thiol:disulfide interchange protein DsbE